MLGKFIEKILSYLSYCPVCGGALEPGKTLSIPVKEELGDTSQELIVCEQCVLDPENISLELLEKTLRDQGVDEKKINDLRERFGQHKAGHHAALSL